MLGRCEELLPELLEQYENSVQLIYLDPPFGTGDSFKMKVNGKPLTRYAYSDVLEGEAYLGLMKTVLSGCKDLLCEGGSIYLHIDYRMSAPLRLIMDELFGAGNFMNEIVWAYQTGGRSTRHYPRKHDTILFYRKSPKAYFNIRAVGVARGPDKRNHMKRFIDQDGRVAYSIRSGGKLYVYHEDSLVFPSDVWTDINHIHQRDPERTGYATQKPEALLRRIILASTQPGDLVMDLFSGSGTTAAVAGQTGRKFVVCDSSPFALHSLRQRLFRRYETHSLMQETQPLELSYPSEMPNNITLSAKIDRAAKHIEISSYVSGGEPLQLIYCAVGTLNSGSFTPAMCTYGAALPTQLMVPVGIYEPVLHIMDVNGQQSFWGL